jgi:hypothetical protein
MAMTGAERQKRYRERMEALIKRVFTSDDVDPDEVRRAVAYMAAQHGLTVDTLVAACRKYVELTDS